jgi:hypothetical protein
MNANLKTVMNVQKVKLFAIGVGIAFLAGKAIETADMLGVYGALNSASGGRGEENEEKWNDLVKYCKENR